MLSLQSDQPMVPVSINGTPRLLVLDTGGLTSQLSRETVKDLNMKPYETNLRIYDVSGQNSHSGVVADSLTLGTLTAQHLPLLISPSDIGYADGLLSNDLLLRYDVDMDFGAHKLSYFSPNHCPGKVVYWNAEVAEVPLAVRNASRLLVEIKLDGKPFNAVIDTGAARSFISMPEAHRVFDLAPGSPGVTPAGPVNGDSRLFSYYHTFSSLTFEGVAVANPTFLLIPDRVGGDATVTGSHIATGDPAIKLPELVLGMDIMRHLHMYFAFKEKKLYVSAAAPALPEATAPGQRWSLTLLDKALALSPTNAILLNNRCYQRALEKIKLEEGLADCEASLRKYPSSVLILDTKGFVLYRLGRYLDALNTYNAVLKIDSKSASSLYMRGQTKRKLGDSAGGDADIAAAKAINKDVPNAFREAGIAE